MTGEKSKYQIGSIVGANIIYVNGAVVIGSNNTIEPIGNAEPCLMQSAFQLDNGIRIIVFSSCSTGIASFRCDENWKPFPKPFATCPPGWVGPSFKAYHQRIRAMHGKDKLVKEHSTAIDE